VSKYWREEVAEQLALAASELRSRRDGSFVSSLMVAMGYLEHAARNNVSPNAVRIWQGVRSTMSEGEDTAQMAVTPDAINSMAPGRPSGDE
jgi:hypothetical protein